MKEKILIKSEKKYFYKLKLITIISTILAILSFVIAIVAQKQGNYDLVGISTYIMIPAGIIALPCIVLFLYSFKMELTVTNKRIYGKTVFGKQIDLPLDSISAVSKGIFESINIATSSGKISFIYISNRNDIYKTITKILIDRQSNNKTSNSESKADELKKYKELLDSNAITQEEYDKKKKELLDL